METPAETTSPVEPPLWAIGQLPRPPLARLLDRRPAAAVVILLILAAYVAGISTFWWIGRDSALYLNLARNFADGHGYTLAGQPHTHVPPGFPLILSSLIGLNAPMLTINALMAFIALSAIGASYLVLSQLVCRPWAILITLAVALLHNTWELGTEVLSDMPFMLLIMTGLLLYYRGLNESNKLRYWLLGSVAFAASGGVRMMGFVVVAAAGLGLLIAAWRKGRAKAIVNLVALAILSAGLLIAFYMYYRGHRDPGASNYVSSIAALTSGTKGAGWLVQPWVNLYKYMGELGRLLTGQHPPSWAAMVLLGLPAALAMFGRLRRGEAVGPLIVILYVGAICVVLREPRVRYLVPLAPLLLLYVVEGWTIVLAIVAPRLASARGWTVATLLIVTMLFNLPLLARSAREKHGEFRLQQDGHYADAIAMSDFIRDNPEKLLFDNVLAEQYIGWMAEVPCPKLSRQIIEGSPAPEELYKLLRRMQVGAVVINRKDVDEKATPFLQSLVELTRTHGVLIEKKGNLEFYGLL